MRGEYGCRRRLAADAAEEFQQRAIEIDRMLEVGQVRSIAQSCEDLAARLPQARAFRMRDAAHLPNLEHPIDFNRTLLEFLGSVGG